MSLFLTHRSAALNGNDKKNLGYHCIVSLMSMGSFMGLIWEIPKDRFKNTCVEMIMENESIMIF